MSFLSRFRPWTRLHAHDFDPAMQTIRGAAAEAQRSRLPQMAAALSYRTIFGVLPVLALGLVMLKGFVDEDRARSVVNQVISGLGLDRIQYDPYADPNFVGPRPAVEAGVDAQLNVWITEIVNRVQKINVAAIGVVGIVVLIYAAISMIVEIERAFNQIYSVPRGRSWARRFSNYTTLLVYSPLCLFLTFYLGQQFTTWTQSLENDPRFVGIGGVLATVLAAGQVFVSAALLLVLYTVVPNTKVRLLPAISGAIAGAVAFEALKFGFIQYVELSAKVSYARLYGSLALIPLFLLWVYLTWMVVLFGLQITYQLQHARFRTRAQPLIDFGPTVVDPAAALVILNHAARAFMAGTPQTVKSIVNGTNLSEAAVQMIVPRLAERGLLVRIDRTGNSNAAPSEEFYILGRSPSTIRVSETLQIGFDLGGFGSDTKGHAPEMVEKMRQAQLDAVGTQTLEQSAGIRPEASDLALADSPIEKTPIIASKPALLSPAKPLS
jgi:membrane protein